VSQPVHYDRHFSAVAGFHDLVWDPVMGIVRIPISRKWLEVSGVSILFPFPVPDNGQVAAPILLHGNGGRPVVQVPLPPAVPENNGVVASVSP
jgi:hypothetical protein